MKTALPHPLLLTTASLALSAAVLGCAPTTAPTPAVAHAPSAHHVYRLDFVVTSGDPGKASAPSKYTVNVEEDRHAEIHVGANVPLGAGNVRQDVGLRLHCQLSAVGDDLLLHNDTELSTADDLPAIHKITARGDAIVSPGKPALVASLEEPLSHRRYEVTVTATKLH